jgi:hypothetical protein
MVAWNDRGWLDAAACRTPRAPPPSCSAAPLPTAAAAACLTSAPPQYRCGHAFGKPAMEAAAAAAIGVQQVLATIRAALSINAAEREPAQAALQSWEQDAAPGFCSSLIRIVEEHASVDEVRMKQRAGRNWQAAVWPAVARKLGVDSSCHAMEANRAASPLPGAQPTRLLAAVIAKNTVGSSWRKTLGTREWSRVPTEEKAGVREAVLRLLLSDPSDRCVL